MLLNKMTKLWPQQSTFLPLFNNKANVEVNQGILREPDDRDHTVPCLQRQAVILQRIKHIQHFRQ